MTFIHHFVLFAWGADFEKIYLRDSDFSLPKLPNVIAFVIREIVGGFFISQRALSHGKRTCPVQRPFPLRI